MFIFAGYMFDPKLQYSLTLTGGYTGVPGSRSLVSKFPGFQPTDRSMADNVFRPGFTQGAWASGAPVKGLSYLAFVGNGLNTLNVSANKIDTNLLMSGSGLKADTTSNRGALR